ncbi:hypothetical protein ARMA_2761 [Ardenticatena maritima]|uniref:DUF4015 domain-containing protein n=1 Tax=Ardenticatena maritima TaxID=872965 RepID=A0A0M9UDR5_9CHLR|nr:putative glycoside hydrolase [Ardenticatena maritima]KPL87270.1 hypothetical protein SE16_12295 [Ardenticatena maritima]GAP64338.1 hypothetical protein ARMA_2761 [Ardenticatena maritima]
MALRRILLGLIGLFLLSTGAVAADERAPTPARTIEIRLYDAETGAPLHAAAVWSGPHVALSNAGGVRLPLPLASRRILALAPGYTPRVLSTADIITSNEVRLHPTTRHMQIVDRNSGQPLSRAVVTDGRFVAYSDLNGNVYLPEGARPPFIVKHGGHQRVVLDEWPSGAVALEPFFARGIYVSYNFLGGPRERLIDLLDRAQALGINTIVLDAKGDRAWLAWQSQHPDAAASMVEGYPTVPLEEALQLMKERGFYTVARVVVFKDDLRAHAFPDLAVRRVDGSVWIDREGLGWVDPARPENWTYTTTLARELAEMGFDEINLDYIRFPTDGNLGEIAWGREIDQQHRVNAIRSFLAVVKHAVDPTPALLSGDVFGLVPAVPPTHDMNIGQIVEEMTRWLDIFCPMTYPSTYAPGNMGVENPTGQPYDVLYRATSQAVARSFVPVRPWLQAYPWGQYSYEGPMLQAQVDGAIDGGAIGWVFWRASGQYDNVFAWLAQQQQ